MKLLTAAQTRSVEKELDANSMPYKTRNWSPLGKELP